MNNRETRKQNYLKIPKSHQLGELAAALSLFATVAGQHQEHPDITQKLFDEPICYAEWLTPEIDSPIKAELATIRSSLQEWQRDWFAINANEIQRRTVIKQMREWSEQMLAASGVVEERLREVA